MFPVAQAVFFFDLYRGGKLTDETRTRFTKEYKWSHAICNQVKNDDKYIRAIGEDINTRTWVPDEDLIRGYLGRLIAETA